MQGKKCEVRVRFGRAVVYPTHILSLGSMLARRLGWLLLDLSHLYHLYHAHTSDVGLKGLLLQNNRRIQMQSSPVFYPNREDIPILGEKV
jgi:hypothetical protein